MAKNNPPNAIYKNREWLYKKYCDEKLSTRQIGKLCGVTHKTIMDTMKKYDIPTRSNGEAKHLAKANYCILSLEAIEWINGELLGDGSLASESPYSAHFRYTSKHKEYIRYILNTLELFGIKNSSGIREYCNKKQNTHHCCYDSKYYSILKSIQLNWYPEGKKIVPKDIRLTPLTCRQWYIGDGSLINHKHCRQYIVLYINGFKIQDVNMLAKRLNDLGFKARRQPSNNAILISVYSTENFLEYIGKCPVKCYQYKWDYNKKETKNRVTNTYQN